MCQNAAYPNAMTEAASSQMLERNMTTATPTQPRPTRQESSPRYAGWRVVLACYLAAVFCWGFGLYGHGVYLTELHRLHGWPTALISGAVTGFYLLTAALVVFVSDAIARLGPRLVMLIGACCFGSAVALLAVIAELWQLYLAYLLMAVGAASMHVGAITNVVGLWFDRQRGLALSLALNGASSGGILVTPVLVLAIAHYRIFKRHHRRVHRDGRGSAAGDRAVDRPPSGRGHMPQTPRPRPPPGPGVARCAARSSGASPRHSPWRSPRRSAFWCTRSRSFSQPSAAHRRHFPWRR